MDVFEINDALRNIVVLVDTREQNTAAFRARLKMMDYPHERQKLDFGDYSAKCLTANGWIDFSNCFAIERKMNLDELCHCYCQDRKRFEREFERARAAKAKLYLLIENASFEKAYGGEYRSQMLPQALMASMLAWLARYDCQLLFCDRKTSGMLIKDIIYREIKERLERGDVDGFQASGADNNGIGDDE